MMRKPFSAIVLGTLFLSCVFLITHSGCGGKGGGSSAPASAPVKGSVSVLVSDGPAVELDHVFIEITDVSLIPAGDGKAVSIFHGREKIDLLLFRDQDFLLAKKDVPVGKYAKIRLEIAAVEVEPTTDCPEVKLPSGKIDLVPRGPFEVTEGASIQVRLDIDAGKSLFIHEAGKSGKCIFRPVVFVDVIAGASSRCPQEIAGTIVKIEGPDAPESSPPGQDDDEEDDGEEEHDSPTANEELAELVIDLGGDRGTTRLEVLETTAIFGADAQKADLAALKVGDKVRARGNIESDGEIEARWVIQGEPADLQGTFETAIADGKFKFKTDESIDGQTTASTLAFPECSLTPVSLDSITPGQEARILGAKVQDGESSSLRAAVIELGPKVVRGTIASLDTTLRKIELKIDETTSIPFTYDSSTTIDLVGDGALTEEDLRVGESVIAHLEAGDRASRIEVEPESAEGIVKDFDAASRTFILLVDSQDPANPEPTSVNVTVAATATVLLIEADQSSSQVDLAELKDGDRVDLFGLVTGESAFDARTVVIRR